MNHVGISNCHPWAIYACCELFYLHNILINFPKATQPKLNWSGTIQSFRIIFLACIASSSSPSSFFFSFLFWFWFSSFTVRCRTFYTVGYGLNMINFDTSLIPVLINGTKEEKNYILYFIYFFFFITWILFFGKSLGVLPLSLFPIFNKIKQTHRVHAVNRPNNRMPRQSEKFAHEKHMMHHHRTKATTTKKKKEKLINAARRP